MTGDKSAEASLQLGLMLLTDGAFKGAGGAIKGFTRIRNAAVDASLRSGVYGEAAMYRQVFKYKPNVVIGGCLPNNAIFITTSGSWPSWQTPIPIMADLAEQSGGMGTMGGNTMVGCCGEFHGANALLDAFPQDGPADIKWTPAVRPKDFAIIPQCEVCGEMFKYLPH